MWLRIALVHPQVVIAPPRCLLRLVDFILLTCTHAFICTCEVSLQCGSFRVLLFLGRFPGLNLTQLIPNFIAFFFAVLLSTFDIFFELISLSTLALVLTPLAFGYLLPTSLAVV